MAAAACTFPAGSREDLRSDRTSSATLAPPQERSNNTISGLSTISSVLALRSDLHAPVRTSSSGPWAESTEGLVLVVLVLAVAVL